jgi:NAD/NADP transhydrogenase beta subunit
MIVATESVLSTNVSLSALFILVAGLHSVFGLAQACVLSTNVSLSALFILVAGLHSVFGLAQALSTLLACCVLFCHF